MNYINSQLATLFFAQFVINIFLIQALKNPIFVPIQNIYQADQKIHKGYIPRLGGFCILFTLVVLSITDVFESALLNYMLLASIPLISITLFEDIFNNIQPKFRLIAIFLSAFFILQYDPLTLPMITMPFFGLLFQSYQWTLYLFFIFALAVIINGYNLIDGVNGLALCFSIATLTILMMLSFNSGDMETYVLTKYFILALLIQLFFNYPYPRMFFGDLGAYVIALYIGFLIIFLFGQFSNLLTWQVLLILFYPAYEILFTVVRRVFLGLKIFEADTQHLHQLIYAVLLTKTKSSLLANNLVVLIMIPIWAFPLAYFFLNDFNLTFAQSMLSMFLLFLIYNIYYFIFYLKLTNTGLNK